MRQLKVFINLFRFLIGILYVYPENGAPRKEVDSSGKDKTQTKKSETSKSVKTPVTTAGTVIPHTMATLSGSQVVASPTVVVTSPLPTTSSQIVTTTNTMPVMTNPSVITTSTATGAIRRSTFSMDMESDFDHNITETRKVANKEDDPRVSWVYDLRKSVLQEYLVNAGLDPEGTQDQLRKRYVNYLRTKDDSASEERSSLEFRMKEPVTYFQGLPSSIGTEYVSSQTHNTQVFDTPRVTSQLSSSSTRMRVNAEQEIAMFKEILRLPPTASNEMLRREMVELVARRHSKVDTANLFSQAAPQNTTRQDASYFGSEPIVGLPTKVTPYPSIPFFPETVHPSTGDSRPIPDTRLPLNSYVNSSVPTQPPNAYVTTQSNVESSTSSLAQTCNMVRKWNLKFDGGKDAVSFLERLSELVDAYAVDKQCLLRALPELLKGQALLWFRNNKDFWQSYEQFYEAFQQHFLPQGYRRMLDDEIKRRTQGENECFRNFVTALTTLIRRRGGYSQFEQLNQIYSNMRPDYKLTIRRENFGSVTEFIQLAESYENYLHERMTYRPPPNPAQSLIPETAYDQKASFSKTAVVESHIPSPLGSHKNSYAHEKSVRYPQQMNRAGNFSTNYPSNMKRPFRNNDFVQRTNPQRLVENKGTFPRQDRERAVKQEMQCYNCGKSGHKHFQCSEPKVIKCIYCKKQGVRTIHCDCREGNEYRVQGAGGALRLAHPTGTLPPQAERNFAAK